MPRFDVTIAGEVNLDLILYGLPDELLRERELLADRMMLTLGGSSSIVAHNLAALGSRVGFQSRIGDDQLGQIALERLEQAGVDVSRVRHVAGATKTGFTVILQRDAWRNIVTYPGTIAELCWEDLDLDYLVDSRHFHLSSDYLQRALRPRVVELLQRMKASGLTVSLDTNDDPDDRWDCRLGWQGVRWLGPCGTRAQVVRQRVGMRNTGSNSWSSVAGSPARAPRDGQFRSGLFESSGERGKTRVSQPARSCAPSGCLDS